MVLFELYILTLNVRMTLMNSIAYIFLLAISLPAWYPAVKKVKDGDMEMGPPKY